MRFYWRGKKGAYRIRPSVEYASKIAVETLSGKLRHQRFKHWIVVLWMMEPAEQITGGDLCKIAYQYWLDDYHMPIIWFVCILHHISCKFRNVLHWHCRPDCILYWLLANSTHIPYRLCLQCTTRKYVMKEFEDTTDTTKEISTCSLHEGVSPGPTCEHCQSHLCTVAVCSIKKCSSQHLHHRPGAWDGGRCTARWPEVRGDVQSTIRKHQLLQLCAHPHWWHRSESCCLTCQKPWSSSHCRNGMASICFVVS